MSKSKSTTLESPPKFLQDKPEPEPAMQEPSPPAYLEVPITDERVLKQYTIIENAQNVLAGMLTMITPEGAVGFNQQTRCFQVAVPEPIKEDNEESN